MLQLLNTDDDDNEIKETPDDIWNLLNAEDKKPDLTSEFRQPQGLGGGTQSTNSTSSLSSTHNTLSSNPQTTNNTGAPPRPSSTDLGSSNLLRGMKRPCDEAHDGNPSKQVKILISKRNS